MPISNQLHELPVTIRREVIALRAFLDTIDCASRTATPSVGEPNVQGNAALNPRPQAIESAEFPILQEVREKRREPISLPTLLYSWEVGVTELIQDLSEVGGEITQALNCGKLAI